MMPFKAMRLRPTATGGAPGPIPTVVGTVAVSGSSAGTTVVWPTHMVGDLLFIECQTSNETVTLPSGFSQIGPQTGTGTPGAVGANLIMGMWKIAASTSEPTVNIPDAGNHTVRGAILIRGVDPSGPVNAFSDSTGTTASITLPGLTTTRGNCLVIHCITDAADNALVGRYSGWTNADLTSVTEDLDGGTNAGNGGGIGAAHGGRAVAGVVGNGSVAFSLGTIDCAMKTIAFQPPLL